MRKENTACSLKKSTIICDSYVFRICIIISFTNKENNEISMARKNVCVFDWYILTRFIIICFVIFSIENKGSTAKSCIENLKIKRKVAQSLTIEWDTNCTKTIKSYKVYYEHNDWWACPDKKSETRNIKEKSGLIVVNNETNTVTITPLHPYSEYKINVKAIFMNGAVAETSLSERNEITGYFNTSQYPPNARPELSNNPVIEDNDTILFSWSPPNSINCSEFNGNIAGYYYVITITDGCNDKVEEDGRTEEPVYQFFKHLPLVNYSLNVYILTETGYPNPMFPLVMSRKSNTYMTIKKYYAPKNVTAIQMNLTHLEICWNSFCDENMDYVIRIYLDEEKFFSKQLNIEDSKILNSGFTIIYKYCFPFSNKNILHSALTNSSKSTTESIAWNELEKLSIEVGHLMKMPSSSKEFLFI